MLKRTISLILFFLLMVSTASAREVAGVDMPETLTFDGVTLGLNGGGQRKVIITGVYSAGLYLQEAMTDPDKIINADEPMAIRMHVTNDFFASSKHVTSALYKGFRGSMPKGDLTPIKDKVEKFNACFSDKITDDEEFDIVYIPNKGTTVSKDGVLKNTVPGYEFKKHVFAIWLGKRPADKGLKEGMLAGDFRVAIAKTDVAKAAQEAKAKAEAAKMAAAQEAKAKAEAAKMAAAQEAKAKAEEAAKMAAAEKAKAEAARMAAAEEAARMKAAQEARAEEAMKMAAAEKAKAEAARMAAAEEAARMKAAREAKAREDARLAAEAQKRAAQAKALETMSKKAALAPMTTMPATSVTAAQVVSEDIMFGFNSAKLSAKAEKLLAKKVEWLKANPDKKVSIQVFCDPSGSRVYNEYLAGKRARSVVKGLTAAGISKDRVEVLGFEIGKSRRAHFTVK